VGMKRTNNLGKKSKRTPVKKKDRGGTVLRSHQGNGGYKTPMYYMNLGCQTTKKGVSPRLEQNVRRGMS